MLKDERQEKIIEILEERKYASVAQLSNLLFASFPTIRRDLTALERQGRIRRSHGGAALPEDSREDIPLPFRRSVQINEKKRLCSLAATLIKDGDLLFIDASSTSLQLIPFLKDKRNLTVVTNSLTVCELLYQTEIRVYCTGGRLLTSSCCLVGRQAEAYTAGFSADLMFFSSSALNSEGIITDYSEEETSLRDAMLRNSRKAVFLCDHSKLGKNSPYRVCSLNRLDYMITDFDSGTDFSAFSRSPLKRDGCYIFAK